MLRFIGSWLCQLSSLHFCAIIYGDRIYSWCDTESCLRFNQLNRRKITMIANKCRLLQCSTESKPHSFSDFCQTLSEVWQKSPDPCGLLSGEHCSADLSSNHLVMNLMTWKTWFSWSISILLSFVVYMVFFFHLTCRYLYGVFGVRIVTIFKACERAELIKLLISP